MGGKVLELESERLKVEGMIASAIKTCKKFNLDQEADYQKEKKRHLKTSDQPNHFPGGSDLQFFQQEDCYRQLQGCDQRPEKRTCGSDVFLVIITVTGPSCSS